MPLIGQGRPDRFPKEDTRFRRGLATQVFVPFVGAGFDVDLGAHSLTALRLISTVTTASTLSPLVVDSTVVVANLNADLLDGQHAPTYTAPLVSSGTASPVISITSADLTHAGSVPLTGPAPATNVYLRATITTGALSWQQIAYADISGAPPGAAYWTRVGAVLSPTTAGDAVTTTGTITGSILKATADGTIWSDGTTGVTPASGAGTRFMWIPAKAALRAGTLDTGTYSTYWDDANIGVGSIALGNDTKASGIQSLAIGYLCQCLGAYQDVAIGRGAVAGSAGTQGSVAIGYGPLADYYFGIAIGYRTWAASASGATAIGFNNGTAMANFKASGRGSVLIGIADTGETMVASGTGSVGIGQNLSATAANAVAIGRGFTNSTANSFAIGFGQVDYIFSATAADFKDSTLVTTAKITGGAFAVGANDGIDATVPVAPVLPATVAGSMTFKKGILTAYTAPS